MAGPAAIRPRRLRPGDTVAVVSPSWGGPAVFPLVFERGLATLRGWGLEVRESPGTRAGRDDPARSPRGRAADLNAAFADPSVAVIVVAPPVTAMLAPSMPSEERLISIVPPVMMTTTLPDRAAWPEVLYPPQ